MVSILGIANHMVEDNPVGSYIGVAQSQFGRVLVCFNEGAGVPTQKTAVLSKVQMEAYGCTVDDTSILHGGNQVIITKCGHHFPLELHNGLCYLNITYPTEEDKHTLDTVILTSDDEWDPSKYNDTVSVCDRLQNMTETVTMTRNLEYTSSGDVILIQSGAKPATTKPRRLSRTTLY